MPAYRVYKVGGDGRIAAAQWIEAESDDAAMAVAALRLRGSAFELWQRNRLVARVEPEGP